MYVCLEKKNCRMQFTFYPLVINAFELQYSFSEVINMEKKLQQKNIIVVITIIDL